VFFFLSIRGGRIDGVFIIAHLVLESIPFFQSQECRRMKMLVFSILLLKWPKIWGRSANRGVKFSLSGIDVLDEAFTAF
jgi:hypothetical protein